MSELHEAAFGGNQEVLEECIHKGINPSQPDPGWGMKTPLHIASAQGHKSCVYYLLNSGARVNAVTDSGWTPGHSACETGQAQCLAILLSNNLDLSIRDHSGDTAERVAEIYEQKECLKIIREHLWKEDKEAVETEGQSEVVITISSSSAEKCS